MFVSSLDSGPRVRALPRDTPTAQPCAGCRLTLPLLYRTVSRRSRAAARRCHLRGGSLPPARGRGAAQPGHHPAAPPGGPHQRRQAPPRRGPPRRGARGPGPAAVRRRPVPRPPLCL